MSNHCLSCEKDIEDVDKHVEEYHYYLLDDDISDWMDENIMELD